MEWTVVTIALPSLIMRKAWNVSRLPTSAVNVLIFPESLATARCHRTGRMSKSGPWSASPSLSRNFQCRNIPLMYPSALPVTVVLSVPGHPFCLDPILPVE
jgi:hypothetical protein